MAAVDICEFTANQLELLSLERTAETVQSEAEQAGSSFAQLEAAGVAITGLEVVERRMGLGGRTLLTMQRAASRGGGPLPPHRLHAGDVVGIRAGKAASKAQEEAAPRALVYRTKESEIVVAVEEGPAEEVDGVVSVIRLANDETFKRYRVALGKLVEPSSGEPSNRLVEVLFGHSSPHLGRGAAAAGAARSFQPFNPGLNASQLDAVEFALNAADLALIHGPPGTGKTTTVVEYVRQEVARGRRVLACAPSNVAVDNIAERLAAAKVRIVRLGHPARLLDSVVDFSLDVQVTRSDSKELANDARQDINAVLKRLGGRVDKSQKFQLRAELTALRKEVRQREARAVEQVMQRAQVVLATNTGAADRFLQGAGAFDVVVIDEAAQALEASCWIPILRGKKLVLAGDHCQLPPTITSREAEKGGLGRTLFDRARAMHPACVHMLEVQYRMHQDISGWSSGAMYANRLQSAEEVQAHLLRDLPGVRATDDTSVAMMLIDTAGCEMGEQKDEAGSTWNEGEALVVREHLRRLLEAGLQQIQLAVITPYNAQVALLRRHLKEDFPRVEIGSVDGFQGREKEAVVLTLVRSNPAREVGFLAEDRRLNVAITRARRHVAVVCDADTVKRHAFLHGLLEYVEAKGLEWRSAMEYLPEGEGSYTPGAFAQPVQSKASSDKTAKGKKAAKGFKDKPKREKAARPPRGEETAEQVARRAALTQEMHAFNADPSREQLQFSAQLTAFERLVVHEVCEGLGIHHVSQGEAEDRFVVCTKKVAEQASDACGGAAAPTEIIMGEPEPEAEAGREEKTETLQTDSSFSTDAIDQSPTTLETNCEQSSGTAAEWNATAGPESASDQSRDAISARLLSEARAADADVVCENDQTASEAKHEDSAENASALSDQGPPSPLDAPVGVEPAGVEVKPRGRSEQSASKLSELSETPARAESLTAALHRDRQTREACKDSSGRISFAVVFNKVSHQIDVSKTDTVASVKKLLEPLTGVLPSAQKLMYKKVLQDHESVGEALKPGVKVMLMGTPTASAGGGTVGSKPVGAPPSLMAELAAERRARQAQTSVHALNVQQVESHPIDDQEGDADLHDVSARTSTSRKSKKGKQQGKKPTGKKETTMEVNCDQPDLSGVDPNDIDGLLAKLELDKGLDSCGMRGCKVKNIEMMGRICPHCKLRYCHAHGMAELHGCGADAKVAARAAWEKRSREDKNKDQKRQQGRLLQPGSTEHYQQALKYQLSKKLEEKTKERERKQPESSGGKKR